MKGKNSVFGAAVVPRSQFMVPRREKGNPGLLATLLVLPLLLYKKILKRLAAITTNLITNSNLFYQRKIKPKQQKSDYECKKKII